MYCAWRIPAHLRCTQCSIQLHLMDICFLTCICLWQISQIQTFLFGVVGPGLVSTSPAFVSNSANHPAGPHAQKTVNGKWYAHRSLSRFYYIYRYAHRSLSLSSITSTGMPISLSLLLHLQVCLYLSYLGGVSV